MLFVMLFVCFPQISTKCDCVLNVLAVPRAGYDCTAESSLCSQHKRFNSTATSSYQPTTAQHSTTYHATGLKTHVI